MNSKKQREALEATAQQESKPEMTIDYFEFLVLVEAAWSDMTILRHSILVKAMDIWYHCLSKNDKAIAFDYFERNLAFTEDIHRRIWARFNPDLQYKVCVKNGKDKQEPLCYLYEGEYWTSSFQFANKDYIKKVTAI